MMNKEEKRTKLIPGVPKKVRPSAPVPVSLDGVVTLGV